MSQCLANGGFLVYQGPEGGIAVKSFQDNLNVTLARVDPASVPPPPGFILSSYLVRTSAAPCGGSPYTVLALEVNLVVSYTDALAAVRDETRVGRLADCVGGGMGKLGIDPVTEEHSQ